MKYWKLRDNSHVLLYSDSGRVESARGTLYGYVYLVSIGLVEEAKRSETMNVNRLLLEVYISVSPTIRIRPYFYGFSIAYTDVRKPYLTVRKLCSLRTNLRNPPCGMHVYSIRSIVRDRVPGLR